MVGNDSSHHLKMFGEVSKPLSAEMSKIFKRRPVQFGHYAQAPSILLCKGELGRFVMVLPQKLEWFRLLPY